MPPIRSTTTLGPAELEPKQSPPSSSTNQHSNDADVDPALDEPFSPELREYQQKAVDAFMEARERGLTRIGLSAPTGAGKTVVFAAIIRQELSKYRRKKALVVVNSEELAEQANEKILNEFEERVQIGFERGTSRAPGRSHVQVAPHYTVDWTC
jgi:ATP-dependent helicase IRC3